MLGCLFLLLALTVFGTQACKRDSCRWTRLQCRNGGVVDKADCQKFIRSGCGTSAWNSTASCVCPPGYFGTECQLTVNRDCPEGYVYSHAGVSQHGLVESECFLDFFKVLNLPSLFLRHHRIKVLSNAKDGNITVTLTSRSGTNSDYAMGRCTKTIEMFSVRGFNCRTRSRTTLDGERQIVMHCDNKDVDSCMDRPEDRENCPSLLISGFKKWGEDQTLPLEIVFIPREPGRYELRLSLTKLPQVGTLTLTGQCHAGQCVRAIPGLIDKLGLDEFEESPALDMAPSSSAFVVGCVVLAFISGLVLALAAAVAHVTKEAHRPVKEVFNRSETSWSASEEAAMMTPGLGRAGSAGAAHPIQRGLFWDSLAFGLRPAEPCLAAAAGCTAARRQPLLLQPSTVRLTGPQLVALVGRSGCGKSTLLDLLAGVHKPGFVQGDRGRIGSDTTLGYVTQTDVLLPALTVWETVEFAARTRSPPDLAPATLRWMVAAVLADLGLENQAGSLASSLSGGERRRLALATDLICSPDILLLDEPTTGLDSTTAALVVNVLRKHVVLDGRLVVLTIHQPARELFPLFDRILLMGPGGRIVYNGAPQSAVEYVAEHTGQQLRPGANPFEFILEALDDGDSVDAMFSEFSSKEAETAADLTRLQLVAEIPPRPSLSFTRQVVLLCQRSFRNSARCSRHLALYYTVTVVVALFLGLSFMGLKTDLPGAQSRLGFFSCASLFLSLTSMASLDQMLHERMIQRKETPRSYSPAAYIVARIAVDVVPYRVIPALVFAAITYGLVGLRASTGPFLMFALILTLVSVAAGASTTLIALLTQRFRTANLAAVLFYLFNFCLGSSLISRQRAGWLARLRFAAIFNYATEALCAVEFDGLTVTVVNDFTGGQPLPIAGDQFLLQTGMRVDRLVGDIVALVVAILGLYGATLLAVYLDPRKTRRHAAWVDPDQDGS